MTGTDTAPAAAGESGRVLLDVRGVRKTYQGAGRTVEAVRDLTFGVAAGELTCIVGPSGAGKTTLLKCVAGLLAPTGGDVRLAGRAVHGPPEDMAVVLMPWRFTNARATRRIDARMPRPVSGLRKSFLSLGAGAPTPIQLVFEQSTLDAEELEAQLAEEQEVYEQLASFGRVVPVAFGSNPVHGLFELGWGDAELVSEDTGHVRWHHWEPLPALQSGAGGLGVPTAGLSAVASCG